MLIYNDIVDDFHLEHKSIVLIQAVSIHCQCGALTMPVQDIKHHKAKYQAMLMKKKMMMMMNGSTMKCFYLISIYMPLGLVVGF